MANFKYLLISYDQSSQKLYDYCYDVHLSKLIINQSKNILEKKLKQNTFKKSSQFINSQHGQWYFKTSNSLTYLLLCDLMVPANEANNFLEQCQHIIGQIIGENRIQSKKFKAQDKEKIFAVEKIKKLTNQYESKVFRENKKKKIRVNEIYSSQAIVVHEVQQIKVGSNPQMPESGNSFAQMKDNFKESPPQTKQTISPSQSWSAKIVILIILIIIAFIVILALAIVLPITLKKYKKTCNYPLCQGINEDVQQYILSKYDDPNIIQALLQMAKSLNSITPGQSQNQYYASFIEQFKSFECLQAIMGDSYHNDFGQIRDLTYQTAEQLQAYIKMIESSSTQNVQILNTNQKKIEQCIFSVDQTTLQIQQNQAIQKRMLTFIPADQCSSAVKQSVVIYLHSFSCSPEKRAFNLLKLKNLIQSQQGLSFDQYKDQGPFTCSQNYFKNFVNNLIQKINQNGYSVSYYQALIIFLSAIENTISNKLKSISQWESIIFLTVKELETYNLANLQANNLKSSDDNVKLIRHYLNHGIKVVLIGHSIGSFYGNAAYQKLDNTQKQSVGMIFIAPIASSNLADQAVIVARRLLAQSDSWVSNPQDKIISYIRNKANDLNIQQPLASNVNGYLFEDIKQTKCFQNCLEGYIKYYPSNIISIIKKSKDSLTKPQAIFGIGPISVTINWINYNDFDLHVFQPNGFQVYYIDQKGISGNLDGDSVTYGPQHYYAPCETVQIGTYTIQYLSYDVAQGSKLLTFIIAGQQSYSIIMDNLPAGSNRDPQDHHKIANIIVTLTENNKVKYSIVPF